MAKEKEPTAKAGTPVWLFKHKDTGNIHAADRVWAPIMAKRSDLELIESPKEDNTDEIS